MNCQHCKPYRLPADAARIAELEALLTDVAMFFDGWFMPDEESQIEADALLERAQKLLSDKGEAMQSADGEPMPDPSEVPWIKQIYFDDPWRLAVEPCTGNSVVIHQRHPLRRSLVRQIYFHDVDDLRKIVAAV
jgi:hypothetical protein